jgi:hypothetical protein
MTSHSQILIVVRATRMGIVRDGIPPHLPHKYTRVGTLKHSPCDLIYYIRSALVSPPFVCPLYLKVYLRIVFASNQCSVA